MKKLNLIYAVVVLAVLTSCEKELDFRYHEIQALPVIEGVLTPEGASIGITMTTPMAEPMDRTLLTDATVSLTDLATGEADVLNVNQSGYFTGTQAGIPGHLYRLDVERGEDRYSATTQMYPEAIIMSMEFEWIKMPYDQVAVLSVRIQDNPSPDNEYYWVKLYRNGEIYRWGIVDDRSADEDGIITYMTMTTRRDTDKEDDKDVLYDGDIVTAEVSMISCEMYDYLEALINGSNGPAMFQGPRSLGYFMATTPVTHSIIFHI